MKKNIKLILTLFTALILLSASGCSPFSGKLEAQIVGVVNSDFFAKYCTDNEKYRYLIDGFDFSGEQLDTFVSEYPYWQGVRVGIEAINKNSFDITVIGIEVGKNGENDIYVSLEPRAVVSISADTNTPQKIWFDIFSDGGEYTNDEIAEYLKDMDIKIIYVDSKTGITDLSDAPDDSLIYESINK